MEIWKDIKDYEGLYQVSNYGRVKSLDRVVTYSNGLKCNHKGKILKPSKDKENIRGKFYKRVVLSKNNKRNRQQVHQLVAKHFVENTHSKKCVNHVDGNPENNHFSNLEWCTYSENERHSYDFLNKINHNRKLDLNAVLDIRQNAVKGIFPFNKEKGNIILFMEKYNVSRDTILNVLNNKYYV